MLTVGTLLKDLDRNTLGEFQSEIDGEFWLRPVGGGHEWNVKPAKVRRATYAEVKRAREEVARLRERARQMAQQGTGR